MTPGDHRECAETVTVTVGEVLETVSGTKRHRVTCAYEECDRRPECQGLCWTCWEDAHGELL